MSVRGVPVQDLPENQDPSVAYLVDEMTGERTPLVVETGEEKSAPKKRQRRKLPKETGSKVSKSDRETADADAESEDDE